MPRKIDSLLRHRRVQVVIAIAVISIGAILFRPLFHLLTTASLDVNQLGDLPPGHTDDASRLNLTKVREIWRSSPDRGDFEVQLAGLLAKANKENLRVSIAGARHSMGGHTIYPDGIVVDMLPLNEMELHEERGTLTVQAGAIWKDVIDYLEPLGQSVKIMQSNNSFSVGGSISVNCHGWQYDQPPIASSVRRFRIMLADGKIVQCSRTENAELFSLALGGYGLFGIILDVELEVTRNARYRLEQYVVSINDALTTFDEKINNRPDVEMAYARMNIVPATFLDEVIINVFIQDNDGELPKLSDAGNATLRRMIFRGSAASDYGKELRWNAETKLQPWLANKIFSRNQLLNEGVEVFENRSEKSTDILHEYFVPRDGLARFVEALRRIVPSYRGNLLNITVREVNEDRDTMLRFADQPMIAFVMLFEQQKSHDDEVRMQAMTRDLINTAIELEGCYYLPYRLHATVEQFHSAYPDAKKFFRLKRKYDPNELFQNQFYLRYAKQSSTNEPDMAD